LTLTGALKLLGGQEEEDRLAPLMSSQCVEWGTPPRLVERVLGVLGQIDLDPASNDHKRPNVPAKMHFTLADDGLAQAWEGRTYLNPPYGRDRIAQWVEKLIAEYDRGAVTEALALVPSRTDSAWFDRLGRFPCCLIRRRLSFVGATGPAPFPSAVFYLGERVDAFAGVFRPLGRIKVDFAPLANRVSA
jgi:hypothetical protein